MELIKTKDCYDYKKEYVFRICLEDDLKAGLRALAGMLLDDRFEEVEVSWSCICDHDCEHEYGGYCGADSVAENIDGLVEGLEYGLDCWGRFDGEEYYFSYNGYGYITIRVDTRDENRLLDFLMAYDGGGDE